MLVITNESHIRVCQLLINLMWSQARYDNEAAYCFSRLQEEGAMYGEEDMYDSEAPTLREPCPETERCPASPPVVERSINVFFAPTTY